MIIYRDHELKNEIISSNYYLFLDDIRFPKNVNFGKLQTKNWIVVRSYNEFVKCISKYGLPIYCSFDHDLAFEHYTDPSEGIYYNHYKEKTGYDCALWLVKYCDEKGDLLPEYQVHSMNPVGKQNITQLLEAYKNNHKKED